MQVKKAAHFKGHQGSVYALQRVNNTSFLSGSGDHHLVLWDIGNPAEGTLLATLPSGIYSMALCSPSILFIGTGHGEIHSIDLSTQKPLLVSRPHTQTVFHLSAIKRKNYLLSSSADGSLVILHSGNLEVVKVFHLGNFKVRCSRINHNETLAYIGCGDGTVAVLDLEKLEIIQHFAAHAHGFSVNALSFSSDQKLLYTASRDACIHVFDIRNNYSLVLKIPAHNYAIYGMMSSPSGKTVSTVSRDKTAKLWPADEWKVLARLDQEKASGHSHSVNTHEWMSDNILLTAGDDRSIIAWELNDEGK